jgi:2-iminobutanoate/2-iminopropanoate deaminase
VRLPSRGVFEPAPSLLSNAVRCGHLVFTTAKSGVTPDGKLPRGVEGLTQQALESLRHPLEDAGADMEQILQTTLLLTSTRRFA